MSARAKKLDELGAVSPIAPPPDPLPKLDAAGIFAPLEPIRYVVQALDMCPGAPVLWAGYGFSGKTIAAQSLALSVAAELPIWGVFVGGRGRVLHIDYEQGSRLTRERYQRLARPHSLTPQELQGWLDLVTMPELYLESASAEAALLRACDGYSLVIIDSLRACAPTIEENASDVRRVLDMLSRISEKTGCTTLVIHHARKPSQNAQGGAKMAIRGSGAIFDACGSVLVFEADKGAPTRVSHEKARTSGKPADDFLLRVNDVWVDGLERGGLAVVAEGAPTREQAQDDAERAKRLKRIERVADEVRELFRREPRQGGTDAIAAKVGHKAADVRTALQLLVAANELKVSGTTRDRSHEWAGRE